LSYTKKVGGTPGMSAPVRNPGSDVKRLELHMTFLVTLIHIVVCLFLIIVVLLQSGKAADLAGAFGGMGSQTTFGPRGSATVLSKATTISAALFMVTSLTLTILATRGAGGSHSALPAAKPVSAPAKPGPAAPSPSGGKPVPLSIPQPTQPPPQPAKK
jgi:preprotein translocase subunit SecG